MTQEPASAVAVEGLAMHFGRTKALEDVSFRVDRGSCFGLLGPNGAGKTTTIRVMAGLLRSLRGSVSILGLRVPDDLSQLRGRVGYLLEDAGFFPRLSGAFNLRLLAHAGRDDEAVQRIPDLLTTVGLSQRDDERVGAYSRGMRQRLALAAALLHDPEVVVLDEPTNGLDPAGVIDLRRIIKELVDDGRTVVFSSHALREVEELCDSVCFIAGGRVVAEGPLASLRSGDGWIRVSIEELDRAENVARNHGWICRVDGVDLLISGATGRRISRTLAAAGLYPSAIREEFRSLEELFVENSSAHATHDEVR